MALVKRSAKAEEDLIDIWLYISDDSPENADRFLDKLNEKAKKIAEFPDIGVGRPELTDNLKSFPVDRYVLFYRVIPEGIELVRVLHSSKDITLIF